jgi:hypothetical protein
MSKAKVWMTLCCFLLAGAISAGAQTGNAKNEPRPAGLWEVTTTMTWIQSPFDKGEVGGLAEGGKHTKQACFTQQMIDGEDALLPQSRGPCHIENKVTNPTGITANWVCSGTISGTGTLETVWTDNQHARGKLHFIGTFQARSDIYPIEWTTDAVTVFKSPKCGIVKPAPLTGNQR